MPDGCKATSCYSLAVEQTFLAWIRSVPALLGLGFTLVRSGVFPREFGLRQPRLHT
jgi:uncharacterized membrane protein YidH (DUF202 family)